MSGMSLSPLQTLFGINSKDPNTQLLSRFVFLVVSTPVLAWLYSTRNRGANPFLLDTIVEPRPHVNEKSERDKVLRVGYTGNKVDDAVKENGSEDFDAIVIGSGIGGLITAALLARSNKKVLVLEQHDQAGGCCHSFTEKGFEFDTGIHYVGEMRNNTTVKFLFDQVSNGQLSWTNVRDDFDTVVIVDPIKKNEDETPSATYISYMSGEQETITSLVTAFPDEKAAITTYFRKMASFRKSLLGFVALKLWPKWICNFLIRTGLIRFVTNFFEYSQVSVRSALSEITKNKKLQAVLSYNFGDYGTNPAEAPLSMHLVLQNHFLKGVSYPTGGSSEIGLHIIPTILKPGGRVFVRARVESIVLDNGKAIGVKMKKDGKIIKAPIVISDAGIYNTVNNLLPPECTPLFKPILDNVRHGQGGFSVYIGLKGTADELGINGKHYWAMWTPDELYDLDGRLNSYMSSDINEFLSEKNKNDNNVPMLFISFPSAKDPLWHEKHPGKSTCTVVTFANYDWFKKWENERVMHRGEEYNALKKGLGDMIWRQTLSLFPQLKDKVEYFEVGTPITNKYYIEASAGEMYGLDHNVQRFSERAAVELRPESVIPNLYLAGQDVFTCGFVGAAFGGLLCASSVLNRNIYSDMQTLKKNVDAKRRLEKKKD